MGKYFSVPPKHLSNFVEVFHHIWDMGIGNDEDQTGVGKRWDAKSLAAAFAQKGHHISDRTIENWHSSSSIPNPATIRMLAHTISDTESYPDWLALLQSAARQSRIDRKDQKAEKSALTAEMTSEPVTSDDTTSTPEREGIRTSTTPLAIIMVLSLLLAVGSGIARYSKPKVLNLFVCSSEQFSQSAKTCAVHENSFPAGVKKIYVSFSFKNVKEGARFKRLWFRDGMKIHEKQSNNLSPWEGWTWYGNLNPNLAEAEPIRPGEYTLQVHVEETIELVTFRVG